MAIVTKDVKGGYVTARFTGSGYVSLNSANTTVGANSVSETVTALQIVNVKWSAANGSFDIKRGANTILKLNGNGNLDFQEDAMRIDSLGGEPQSNVVVTTTGAPNGFVTIKMHKKSTFVTEY